MTQAVSGSNNHLTWRTREVTSNASAGDSSVATGSSFSSSIHNKVKRSHTFSTSSPDDVVRVARDTSLMHRTDPSTEDDATNAIGSNDPSSQVISNETEDKSSLYSNPSSSSSSESASSRLASPSNTIVGILYPHRSLSKQNTSHIHRTTPLTKREKKMADLTEIWERDILPKWNPKLRHSRKVQQLCWEGIPPSVRCQAWPAIIGNDVRITRELFEILVQKGRALTAQQQRDAHRIASQHQIRRHANAARAAISSPYTASTAIYDDTTSPLPSPSSPTSSSFAFPSSDSTSFVPPSSPSAAPRSFPAPTAVSSNSHEQKSSQMPASSPISETSVHLIPTHNGSDGVDVTSTVDVAADSPLKLSREAMDDNGSADYLHDQYDTVSKE